METANEGGGDNLAKSTTASEQIADGPPSRDSENNDSPFKEDTLQQMLTCETGNTGTKASTPPCDKGTTGRGLHGTSPAKDNIDKEQDAILLIQLEVPEVAEADGLEGPMDLEVTSSDESGDWETASEASVAYEESTNVKGEKQDESLDDNEKMDICSPKETGDCLELQMPSGHVAKTGSEGTGELAEGQICEMTYSKGFQVEQAFTHGEESLCDDGKTESMEILPHADEALRKRTVNEEPDPNVEGTVTEESGSCFVNTEFHIEKLTDEASGTGVSVTHVEKIELQDEQAVNEWTRPHEDKGSHNEEGAIKGIEAPFEETVHRNMDLQKGIAVSEQDEPQMRELTCEVREPVPHTEETVQRCRESLVKVTESESVDPNGNELVRIETEPDVVKILIEQCSPPLEEAVNVGTGHQNEPVSDHARSHAEEVASDGTGHHDEEKVRDHAKSHGEWAVSDETGHHDEEIVRDHAKSRAEEPDDEGSICSAETNELYVKETASEESGPYVNENDYERTVTYDEACVGDQKGTCIGEIVAEGTEVDTNIEEMKSDQTLSAELEGNSITKVTEENDSGDVIGKEQGPLDTSTSKEAVDKQTDKVNNEEVVDSQPTTNKGFNVDQKETAEDEIENDITERVSEETTSKVTAQDLKEGRSQLLDVDIEDIVNKETECASTEMVFQVLSGAVEETEAECVYIETANEHSEEGHKETLIQVTLDPTRGTVIEDTLGDYVKSDCKEIDDGSLEVFREDALYKEPVTEDLHTDSRDTPEYETVADAIQTIESVRVINALQTIESVEETPTVDHKEMLDTVKETSDSDSIERQNEKVTYSFVETFEQGKDAQNMDNTFVERIVIEPSSEEQELAKPRARQESEELVSLKELYGEISENLPNIQNLNYELGEEDIRWYAEETGLQALKKDIETTWLKDESLGKNLGEVEANLTFPEHLLKEESHKRLLEIDVDQAVSINDGISYMDVSPDKGTKIDTTEQVPLDEGGESDKYPSLNDMEIKFQSISGMVVKPLPMRPMVFSNDSFQNFNVVEEPNLQNFQMGDGVESFGNSHHKDFTDFQSREQGSPLGETLSNRLQTETIEQTGGVIKVARIVGPERRVLFSEGHKELAEDEPDCYFNQGSVFDKGLENSIFLPQTKPFTKPETDEVFGQEATLTVEDLSNIILSHGGPVVDDQGRVDSSTKTVQHADGTRADSLPILITRQRSNTDPCLIYDEEEKDNTQQDDQHEKGKPRPRLRSVTPPLDNFTVSFTATTPQAILEVKPLEKAQTSIVYPDVDYNISEEQKTEEATPKQDFTFFPTQIFNPLFFVKEGGEEHGFYQYKPLLPSVKENINKKWIPSPPRDTEVPMRVQQPQTISRPSRSPAKATTETSAADPSAAQPVTPLWLPPRPLRHTESAVGKDFRPLKPTENYLVRRPTVRHKKNTVGGASALKRFSAMNLPTIPQEVPSGEKSSLEKSSRPAGTKVHISDTTRHLPRQLKVNEQDVAQPKNKSPMERLAEAEESSRKYSRSPETVLKRIEKKPPISEKKQIIPRRYSNFIHAYSDHLLYQEYSDVALNQEIQRQKPGDSPAEEKDPGSPRQRRRILSSQDSYLQRLSISSADSLWQDLPKVRDSVTFMSMSREEQKLQEAKFELIMSEALYLRSLNIAVDHFQRSTELQDVLSIQDRQWLYSRLSEVREASNDFLFDLEEEFEDNMYKFQVCDVVISHEPNFRKVYLPYVTNQTYQERTFQRLMNDNPRFQQVLSKLESDPVCQRLSLKSFLILPFQRITRLRLLLQSILKRSAPGSNEELQATEAHNVIEKLIRDCNEGVQKMNDTEELILLHQKIQFECKIFPLISASRRLVKHGEVTSLEFNPISFKWKGTTRQVYLHLFSDCLLLSRIREGGRFVVFDHASDFRVERCEIKLHSNQKTIFRVFLRDSAATQARDGYVDGQEMQYIFRTETQSQKLRWIYALSPPRREIDFLRDGLTQVQCLKSYKARENDEMSLEKADILMVIQNSDDGWLCGIRLSDLHSGWFPQCHVQAISRNACLRNLQEEQRLQNARAKLHPTGAK